MRKRFWVSMIICLLAMFSIPTFVALSKKVCKGPSICAEARVYGGSKLTAKARVSSPSSVKGTWGYRVQAGSQPVKTDSGPYTRGYSRTWKVSDYTSSASAHACNDGLAKNGTTYYASASESSGG